MQLLLARAPTVDEALGSVVGSSDSGAVVRLMKLHSSSAEVQALGCKVNPTPYTLHPTPYTLHPAPCTLNSNPAP